MGASATDGSSVSGGASADQGSKLDTTKKEAVGRSEDLVDASDSQPFKKLGDVLEKWFNQNRQIQRPQGNEYDRPIEQKRDTDMVDVDFEHLLNEESQAEAQALGTASEDQARALDEGSVVPS